MAQTHISGFEREASASTIFSQTRMAMSSARRDVLNESGLKLKDGKATNEMEKSLSKLADLLLCPLCDKVNYLTTSFVGPPTVCYSFPRSRSRLSSSLFVDFVSLITFRLSVAPTIDGAATQIFDKPITLSSCAHSFCVDCIDSYSCNSWTCPGRLLLCVPSRRSAAWRLLS